jgi:hypothetical protein
MFREATQARRCGMFTERHGKFTERHVYRQGTELKSARALLKRVAERCPGPVEGERSTRLVLFGRAPLATWQRHVYRQGAELWSAVSKVFLVSLPTERSKGMPPVGTSSVFSTKAKEKMCTQPFPSEHAA